MTGRPWGEELTGSNAGTRVARTIGRGHVGGGTLLLVALAFLASPQPTLAQVGDRGSISVEVRDEAGSPLQGVQVYLSRPGEEDPTAHGTSSSTGRVDLRFLRPGLYGLTVERLGFIPIRVRDVDIVPDERQHLQLVLRPGQPPVTEVDEYPFTDLVVRRTPAGSELLRNRPDALVLSSRSGAGILELSRAAAEAGPPLSLRHLGLRLDGTLTPSAWSPVTGPGLDLLDPFAVSSLDRARYGLPAHPANRPVGAGSLLDLTTPAPWGGSASGRVAMGADLSTGEGLGPDRGAAPWVEVLFSTPLRGDTVRTTSGFTLRQANRPLPVFLAPESIVAESLDAMGADAPSEGAYRSHSRNVLTGFSRLDWAIGESTAWSILAHAAVLPEGDGIGALPPLPEGITPAESGADLLVASRLLSASEDGNALHFNVSFHRSSRTTGDPEGWSDAVAGPSLLDRGLVFGPVLDGQGEFDRTRFELSPGGTWTGERLRLSGGMTLGLEGWNDRRPAASGAHRLLPAPGSVGPGTGILEHATEGAERDRSVSSQHLSVFGEARWSPTAELRLVAGARIDWERLPFEDLEVNEAWNAATGIVDPLPEGSVVQFSPSGALRWEPAALPGLGFTVTGALHPGTTEPGLIGEVFHDREGAWSLRTLGTGPGAVEYRGDRLTLVGPEFRAPRTSSVAARIDGNPVPSLRLGVEVFRDRTDYLPRRRDLNRVPGAGIVDQFGREHRGVLVREGDLITHRPGSDRRFPGFDRVWALEADGWSDTRGVGAGVTWEAGPLLAEANYRFSETTDNAPHDPAGAPYPLPGQHGTDLRDAGWVEGVADRDRPHQLGLLAALEVENPFVERFSISYQLRSGRPFTPGVRDALGSGWEAGWSRLEAIALPSGESLPTVGDGWSCDRTTGAGGRLQRNACRGEALHALNLGVLLSLPDFGPGRASIRIEALNLLDRSDVLRDPALFVVDGSTDFQLSPGGGSVTLPVTTNPTFGEPVVRLDDGRLLRIGLEYNFR
jgi:hypothetical protein